MLFWPLSFIVKTDPEASDFTLALFVQPQDCRRHNLVVPVGLTGAVEPLDDGVEDDHASVQASCFRPALFDFRGRTFRVS